MRDLCTQDFLRHQRVGRRHDPIVLAKLPAAASSPVGGPPTDYDADAHQTPSESAGRITAPAGGRRSWLWLLLLGGCCLAVAIVARRL